MHILYIYIYTVYARFAILLFQRWFYRHRAGCNTVTVEKGCEKMGILNCKRLKRSIGSLSLGEISFALEPGYILGVIGSNGAGKTTLLKCLMGGLSVPQQVRIELDGYSLAEEPVEAKKRMAFVLTDCPFVMGFSAAENVRLWAPLYDSFQMEVFHQWMEHFHLDEKCPLRKLSKGGQIKFQLAFALSYKANVYFVDEPSANLDVEFREEFYRIMRDIVSDGTKSVVYVTQLVEELEGLADYILWLEAGQELLYLDMEELLARFTIVSGLKRSIDCIPKNLRVGAKYGENHNEALLDNWQGELMLPLAGRRAKLEEILYYFSENPASIQYFLMEHNEKSRKKSRFGESFTGGGIYV